MKNPRPASARKSFASIKRAVLIILLLFGAHLVDSEPRDRAENASTRAASVHEREQKVASSNRTATARQRTWSNAIRFTENRGQIIDTDGNLRSDIRYSADAGGVQLYFTPRRVTYVFSQEGDASLLVSEATGKNDAAPYLRQENISQRTTLYRVDMELVGTGPDLRIHGEAELDYYTNYYLAHCPEGITEVKCFNTVKYENVYENIDLVFHAMGERVKYDFIVHPGGNPANIKFRYRGTNDVCIGSNGGIQIRTPLGDILEESPYSYQAAGFVESSVSMDAHSQISFELGEYDISSDLIIDPWSTYLGSSGSDMVYGVSATGSGGPTAETLLCGVTNSTTFPVTAGALQQTNGGGGDAFVMKMLGSGTVQWCTYYGGSGGDEGRDICFDANSSIVVAGRTQSTDLPVLNAWQSNSGGGRDAFILKLSGSGLRSWCTYLGGSADESSAQWGKSLAITTDLTSAIYVAGRTGSSDFPVFQAQQATYAGGVDCFLSKLTSNGGLVWSTYFGGSNRDDFHGVAVTGSTVTCGGITLSNDFPTQNPLQAAFGGGGHDAVMVSFDTSGVLLWSTYYGGSGDEQFFDVSDNNSGLLLFAGWTQSTDFPLANATQSALSGSRDIVLVEVYQQGGSTYSVLWSTYFGGSGWDTAFGCELDGAGNAIVCGQTSSIDYPTHSAFQNIYGGGTTDAFVTKFSPIGQVQFSTYLGGDYSDDAFSITSDGQGNIYTGGQVASGNFPTHLSFQATHGGGGYDGFACCLSAAGFIPVELVSFSATCLGSDALLKWCTASEVNSYGFIIERIYSSGGTAWEDVGFVPSACSVSENWYHHTDPLPAHLPFGAIIRYRLRQIDQDGVETVSPVVEVHYGEMEDASIVMDVYPNPTHGNLWVNIRTRLFEELTLTIFDRLGRQVLPSRLLSLSASESHTSLLEVGSLPTGTYLVVLKSENCVYTKPCSILRR